MPKKLFLMHAVLFNKDLTSERHQTIWVSSIVTSYMIEPSLKPYTHPRLQLQNLFVNCVVIFGKVTYSVKYVFSVWKHLQIEKIIFHFHQPCCCKAMYIPFCKIHSYYKSKTKYLVFNWKYTYCVVSSDYFLHMLQTLIWKETKDGTTYFYVNVTNVHGTVEKACFIVHPLCPPCKLKSHTHAHTHTHTHTHTCTHTYVHSHTHTHTYTHTHAQTHTHMHTTVLF